MVLDSSEKKETAEGSIGRISASIVDTVRVGNHTEYVMAVLGMPGGGSSSKYIRRRYSAFIQLQQLIIRLFKERKCCAGRCLLEHTLRDVFFSTDLRKSSGLLRSKNSVQVVHQRVYELNVFLARLHQRLVKCPPGTIEKAEAHGCRVARLLLSFMGGLQPHTNPASPSET